MASVLVIGGGGREHALGWKVKQSKAVEKVYFAPGNAGSREVGENVPISVGDFEKLKEFAVAHNVETVVVGPEDPLCNGVHDSFAGDEKTSHIVVVGPKKAGALLEGSKAFSKEFMKRHNVPTAKYEAFTKDTVEEGCKFIDTLAPMGKPFVLKSDGLAGGKGVLIIKDVEEAKKELREMFEGKFGKASDKVVIEEYLDGVELSVFALIDSKGNYKLLPTSCDFKRAQDDDAGLNTGGMGAVSPSPFAIEGSPFMKLVDETVVKPTVAGLVSEDLGYVGFLYVGLMNVDSKPFVVEFNCRMGDPETEVVMPRIKSDLYPLLRSLKDGKLSDFDLEIDPRHAAAVMMVSGGYPGSYPKGKEITGLDSVTASPDITTFHAGTAVKDAAVVTSGGRVLAVAAVADTLKAATAASYAETAKITFDGAFYRKDIAKKLIAQYDA